MATYSPSKLGTFESCPLMFKFRYIDKIKVEVTDTVETFLGSRVHDTLEKLYKDLKFQKTNTLQQLLDFFEEIWEKNWNDNIIIVRENIDKSNWKQMGVKFITDYYNKYKPFDQEQTIDIEKSIFFPLDETKQFNLRGYIDRLASKKDGTYVIHDYKTSGTLPEIKYIEKDRQLALYALAIKNSYIDCSKVEVAWHYLAFDKEIR
ncbi:RecB family exonuclease, partial [Pseudomonadota bacterium]